MADENEPIALRPANRHRPRHAQVDRSRRRRVSIQVPWTADIEHSEKLGADTTGREQEARAPVHRPDSRYATLGRYPDDRHRPPGVRGTTRYGALADIDDARVRPPRRGLPRVDRSDGKAAKNRGGLTEYALNERKG